MTLASWVAHVILDLVSTQVLLVLTLGQNLTQNIIYILIKIEKNYIFKM